METTRLPLAVRAIASGVVAVGVLSGMLVLHAWPVWTGESIYLRVRPVDPRSLFRGDYVVLGYDVDRLRLRVPPALQAARPDTAAADADMPAVDPIGDWWRPLPFNGANGARRTAARPRTVYLQLRPEPTTLAGVPAIHIPVSLSDHPIDGAVNLAGRVRGYADAAWISLDFGIDALFVREGAGRPIEDAIGRRTPVVAEIAVTRTGRARVRALVIDGRRTP